MLVTQSEVDPIDDRHLLEYPNDKFGREVSESSTVVRLEVLSSLINLMERIGWA